MARYDKVDPYTDLHRAPLAAAWPAGDIGKPYGCGLDAQGRVVKGKGNQAHVRFIIVLTKARKAGAIVDMIKSGELLDFGPTAGNPGTDFGVAGTDYFAHPTTGVISNTAVDGSSLVGTTVEGSRLIVNVEPHQLAVDVP